MADSMRAEEDLIDDPSPIGDISVTPEEMGSGSRQTTDENAFSGNQSAEKPTASSLDKDLSLTNSQMSNTNGTQADSQEQISSQNITLDASLVDALGNLSQEDSQRTIRSSQPNTENTEEMIAGFTESEGFDSVQDSEQSTLPKSPEVENSEELIEATQSESVPDSEPSEALEDRESQEENERPQRLTKLPPSRIKSIIKMDPDVVLISQDSVFLITKATEMFIQEFGKQCQVHSMSSKRKTVQKKDIEAAINTIDAFQFLDDVLETFT